MGDVSEEEDEKMQKMTLKRLNSAFNAADVNGDGTVDYDEFLQVLHPEMKDKERLSQLMKQKTVEENYAGAKFNISNKRAKGSIIQPKTYKSKGLLSQLDEDESKDEFEDMDRLEKENENLKSICENQAQELKQKDAKIESLEQSLKEKDG